MTIQEANQILKEYTDAGKALDTEFDLSELTSAVGLELPEEVGALVLNGLTRLKATPAESFSGNGKTPEGQPRSVSGWFLWASFNLIIYLYQLA